MKCFSQLIILLDTLAIQICILIVNIKKSRDDLNDSSAKTAALLRKSQNLCLVAIAESSSHYRGSTDWQLQTASVFLFQPIYRVGHPKTICVHYPSWSGGTSGRKIASAEDLRTQSLREGTSRKWLETTKNYSKLSKIAFTEVLPTQVLRGGLLPPAQLGVYLLEPKKIHLKFWKTISLIGIKAKIRSPVIVGSTSLNLVLQFRQGMH